MGLFNRKSIDEYVAEANAVGATLLDVRDFEEYEQSHIPGATCIPLHMLDGFAAGLKDKNETVYVYCASGVRSFFACRKLRAAGFANVTNIGGINSYHGPREWD